MPQQAACSSKTLSVFNTLWAITADSIEIDGDERGLIECLFNCEKVAVSMQLECESGEKRSRQLQSSIANAFALAVRASLTLSASAMYFFVLIRNLKEH